VNRLLGGVSVISVNKLSLQKLTQLIGIKLLILPFLEFFLLSPNFQGGKMLVYPPLRTPMPVHPITVVHPWKILVHPGVYDTPG